MARILMSLFAIVLLFTARTGFAVGLSNAECDCFCLGTNGDDTNYPLIRDCSNDEPLVVPNESGNCQQAYPTGTECYGYITCDPQTNPPTGVDYSAGQWSCYDRVAIPAGANFSTGL